MKIVGCDLYAKQQSIAMVDTETGEFTEKTLSHEGVREFYAALEGPVVVGIEATGAMQWSFGPTGRVGDGLPGGSPTVCSITQGAPFRRWRCQRSQPTPKEAPSYNAFATTSSYFAVQK